MRNSNVKIFIGIFLITSAISLTGCDFFKNKQKGQSNTSQAVNASQPGSQASAPAVALPPDVLVRVGNWTLTKQAFDDRIKILKKSLPGFKEDANTEKMVLDELIRQQLLVQDAESSGIGDSKEVKDALDDFRRTLLVQELANRLTKNIAVTPTEARTFYDENKDKFIAPFTWTVREIVVPDESSAKNILVQILQGGDFSRIATEQSKGESASVGGALKPFIKAPFPEMQSAIANLDAGGVSTVFKGPQGYYIVKVDAKKGGEQRSFTDVQDALINGLTLQKQQAVIVDYLNKLAQKNKVEINKPVIDQMGAK